MVQLIEDQPNRVSEFFVDKTLLITGATGFLGKVLLEKLLRSCTGLKKIYVIVRDKKGKGVKERLDDLFNGPLFDLVREQHGNGVFAKVEGISGDFIAPDLALSEGDRRKLTDETQIIYHSAATVKFDEPLKNSVLINVRGTKLMLALAKECRKLMVFSHLSTAYCHEDQEMLEEKTYPPPTDPERTIKMCEWMDDKVLGSITEHIRGTCANNYTFSKALGEGLVNDQINNLPIVISRPSAVISIWKEPIPGWNDNLNGPTGLLIGAGKGVLRSMYGNGDYFADYVPVDIIANGLICSVYDYATHNGARKVYNMTGSNECKMTFQEVIDMGRSIVTTKLPFDWVLWYPGGSMKNSRLLHNIDVFLFQLIPAVVIDAFLLLLGYKPFLIKVQRRIIRGYEIFEYYTNRKWSFSNDNAAVARSLLNAKERAVFKVDSDGVDLYEYTVASILGARRYILKETDDGIPSAIRRMKVMWCLDRLCKILIVLGLLYFIYNLFASFST